MGSSLKANLRDKIEETGRERIRQLWVQIFASCTDEMLRGRACVHSRAVANLELLLKNGANKNAKAKDGRTPLEKAKLEKRNDAVEIFGNC